MRNKRPRKVEIKETRESSSAPTGILTVDAKEKMRERRESRFKVLDIGPGGYEGEPKVRESYGGKEDEDKGRISGARIRGGSIQ